MNCLVCLGKCLLCHSRVGGNDIKKTIQQNLYSEYMINNKLTKKYYSASEVIERLNIALHQLRYLETKIPDLSNYKINNRKYYTANDIELLQKSLSVSRGAERIKAREHTTTYKDIAANFGDSSSRIDILLTNFHNLSLQIKKILADSSMTCV